MPGQKFTIIRAPEAKLITAQEIEYFLYKNRRDTEWKVVETSVSIPDSKMEKEEARVLVKKLCNAAFVAGEYSRYPTSLILKSETEKALLLSAKIERHLTNAKHLEEEKASEVCPECKRREKQESDERYYRMMGIR